MKPLIVANWKMNPQTSADVKKLFGLVKRGLKDTKNTEVVICPPFLYLLIIKYQASSIKLGAQDCFWEKAGAFTSGVSAFMLKDIGCRYVILGHSERRIYFGDNNEIINKKIKVALSAKLNPVFCIGETENEKEKGETENILKSQIKRGLDGISEEEMKKIVVAYEPVWAIGTGNPCGAGETRKMVSVIRQIISNIYPSRISDSLRILYGGSINSENVRDYILESGVNGFVIGGASLNPKEFIKIIRIISRS